MSRGVDVVIVVSEGVRDVGNVPQPDSAPRKPMPTWAALYSMQQLTKSGGVLCTVYALKARTQQVPSVPFEVQEHGNHAVRLSSRR